MQIRGGVKNEWVAQKRAPLVKSSLLAVLP